MSGSPDRRGTSKATIFSHDAPTMTEQQLRNVAIVARVAHGETTLLDGLLEQSNVFRGPAAAGEPTLDPATVGGMAVARPRIDSRSRRPHHQHVLTISTSW